MKSFVKISVLITVIISATITQSKSQTTINGESGDSFKSNNNFNNFCNSGPDLFNQDAARMESGRRYMELQGPTELDKWVSDANKDSQYGGRSQHIYSQGLYSIYTRIFARNQPL